LVRRVFSGVNAVHVDVVSVAEDDLNLYEGAGSVRKNLQVKFVSIGRVDCQGETGFKHSFVASFVASFVGVVSF
jgi:hypothetical protein